MSRYYQAPGSGIIYYNLTILAWITLLSSFCLEFGLSYCLASGRISASELTGLALVWTLLAGILIFIILILFPRKIIAHIAESYFVYLSVIYIMGNLLISFFSALFYSLKNFVTSNFVLILSNCILIFLIPKGTAVSLSKDRFIYIYIISFLIQGILLFSIFFVKNVADLKLRLPSRANLRFLLELSFWALFSNALSMLLYRIDYYFVNRNCTPSELGNYIQASKIIQVLLVLPSMASSVLFPIIAGRELKNPVKNIQSLTRSLLFFTIIFEFVLIFAGRWLFPYLFGNSFEFMYKIFNLLAPGVIAFCVICPITAYYGGKKILYVNLIALIISVCFVTTLYSIVVPLNGIYSAAIISSLGYIFYAAILLWFFNRHYKVSMINFFTFRLKDFEWIKNLVGKAKDEY